MRPLQRPSPSRAGEVEALMKGSLHTDELMHEVLIRETGLVAARRGRLAVP
jgi:phosphate acetyltransferase